MNYLYLCIDLGSVLIPFLFSFHPRLQFHKEFIFFIPANLIIGTFFLIWDHFFTKMGVWGFNPDYITGFYLGNLPIEEVLFFICIPFACVFSFHSLNRLKPFYWKWKFHTFFSILLIITCLFLIVFYTDRWYTVTTSIGIGIFIILMEWIFKPAWWSSFYKIFMVLLIPFFLVNGILTGTGLKEPIVWYHNAQNLGVRLGTIPLEDTLYGMLLIGMNLSLYFFFKVNWSKRSN